MLNRIVGPATRCWTDWIRVQFESIVSRRGVDGFDLCPFESLVPRRGVDGFDLCSVEMAAARVVVGRSLVGFRTITLAAAANADKAFAAPV